MAEELVIDIAPDGALKVEANGYKGTGCIEALNKLLEDLNQGGIETNIKDQKMKQEFYATSTKQEVKTSH